MGTNQFSALSKEEFSELHLSSFPTNLEVAADVDSPSTVQLNVDWVSYGAVSPVKDEGACKANYAFSAAGAIEGISAIFFKQQTEYSVQELIDCTGSYGNQGCTGGTMNNAFNFILTRGTPPLTQASTPRRPTPTWPGYRPARPAPASSASRASTTSAGA
jgi:C1A family cysteine protease